MTPKITDFGLAKRLDLPDGPTQTGSVLGTPCYMAPEQAAGRKDIGPPADVWALGAILYECLTGRPPFRGETTLDTLEQVRSDEAVPPRRLQPKLPRELETVCLKCLRKDPAERYASAAELADDLGRFLDGVPVRARPTPLWRHAAAWARRRPAPASLGAVSAIAVVALLAVWAYYTAELKAATAEALNQKAIADQERAEAEAQANRAGALITFACASVEENLHQTIQVKGEVNPDIRPGALYFNFGMVNALASATTRNNHTLTPEDRARLAEEFAARAVRLLRDAHRFYNYYREPGKLELLRNAPELAPVRDRADFRALLAQLAKDHQQPGGKW